MVTDAEILNVATGNIEQEDTSLKPSKVTIVGFNIKRTKKDETPLKIPLVEFLVKHPDKEEHIVISKIKQLVGESLHVNTTWFIADEEQKLQKGSPLANLLAFKQVDSIGALEGHEIDTVKESDDSKYLVLKAY